MTQRSGGPSCKGHLDADRDRAGVGRRGGLADRHHASLQHQDGYAGARPQPPANYSQVPLSPSLQALLNAQRVDTRTLTHPRCMARPGWASWPRRWRPTARSRSSTAVRKAHLPHTTTWTVLDRYGPESPRTALATPSLRAPHGPDHLGGLCARCPSAAGTMGSTWLGHYPWFLVYNAMNGWFPVTTPHLF